AGEPRSRQRDGIAKRGQGGVQEPGRTARQSGGRWPARHRQGGAGARGPATGQVAIAALLPPTAPAARAARQFKIDGRVRQRYIVAMEMVKLAVLADAVRERAPAGPLDRIEAALAVSEELTSGADELTGRFVEEARQAGCSWTEIGQRIGVSKQAARQ